MHNFKCKEKLSKNVSSLCSLVRGRIPNLLALEVELQK